MNKKNICILTIIWAAGNTILTTYASSQEHEKKEHNGAKGPSSSGYSDKAQQSKQTDASAQSANNPAPAMQIKPLPTPPPVMKSPDKITTQPQPLAQPNSAQTSSPANAPAASASDPKTDQIQKMNDQIGKLATATKQYVDEVSKLDSAGLAKKKTDLLQEHVNKSTDLDQAFAELKRLSTASEDITKNSAAIQVQLNRIINDTTELVSTHIVMDAIESKK